MRNGAYVAAGAAFLFLALSACGDSSDESSSGGSWGGSGGASGGSGGSSGSAGAGATAGAAGSAGASGTAGASGAAGAAGSGGYEVPGTWYYLDADEGSDDNDGLTLETAWQTLAHARDTLAPGDGVLMQSAEYGSFGDVEAPQRDDYITFKADDGQTPILTAIRARYSDPTDAYLRFDGVRVEVEWKDPGADPQHPDASSSTYTKAADPFSVKSARYVELLNTSLVGTNKYLTVNGVRIENSEDVIVARTSITRTWTGFWIGGSTGVTVDRNYVHAGVGSCIRVLTNNTDTVVSSNHCHDFNWSESDDYCTRGSHTPHGSAISVRSGDLVIRRNVFHDGWGSSGMMLYDCDGGVTDCEYSHVLIENNVLYDINNTYPLRIYRMGEDVVVRNNLLAGRYRYKDGTTEHTNDGRYYYESAFALHTIAEPYDASDLTVSGNVFVGILFLPSGVNEHHNIAWSYKKGGEWTSEAGEGSTVATCEYGSSPADFFETGFFAEEVDFSPRHNKLLDFTPAPSSPAIGAGDADFQPPDSLGSIGADGFIRDDGTARDADHHSVGPYEP